MNTSTLRWLHLIHDHAPASLAPLAQSLALSAIVTEARIAEGERAGVRQSEETITETVLLDLAREVPGLRIRTLTRAQERREGADWEWWIEGREGWFHVLVQAKRVHVDRGGSTGYDIGYRPRGRVGEALRPRQVDSLIDSAHRLGAPAIYALYNQVEEGGMAYADPQCFCSAAVRSNSGIDGITVLSAMVAHRLLPAEGEPSRAPMLPLARVRRHASPWSCLATCVDWRRWDHDVWWPFFPVGPSAGDDLAAIARDFVLGLDFRAGTSGRYRRDQEDAARLASSGLRAERAPYLPGPDSVGLDATDQAPHPLSEVGAAPRFVAALYQG